GRREGVRAGRRGWPSWAAPDGPGGRARKASRPLPRGQRRPRGAARGTLPRMPMDVARHVRPARRPDLARLAELRHWYLAETARLEPRFKLLPDARERIQQAVSAWLAQEDREVLVAEEAAGEGEAAGEPAVVGYATGLYSVWPPIFRAQRVGEVSECFVIPAAR